MHHSRPVGVTQQLDQAFQEPQVGQPLAAQLVVVLRSRDVRTAQPVSPRESGSPETRHDVPKKGFVGSIGHQPTPFHLRVCDENFDSVFFGLFCRVNLVDFGALINFYIKYIILSCIIL